MKGAASASDDTVQVECGIAVRFQEVSMVGLSIRIWALLPDSELAEDWKRHIPNDMGATREDGEDRDAM